jgi:hypothetical protein
VELGAAETVEPKLISPTRDVLVMTQHVLKPDSSRGRSGAARVALTGNWMVLLHQNNVFASNTSLSGE